MKSFHPSTIFIFYASLIISLMLVNNPMYVFVSLIGAVTVLFMQQPGRKTFKELMGFAVIFVIMSLVNPLFVHRGSTPLFFLNGRAITLEAVLYGINSSAQLVTAILWCRSFSIIMTSDRLFCLVGKLSPKISAMLMMTVRFIPDLISQSKKLSEYSIMTGQFDETSFYGRIKRRMNVFSALVTWSIENGIQTADSMKARGFELSGRTSYSVYRIALRDIGLMLLSICSAVMTAAACRTVNIDFYPKLKLPENTNLLLISAVFTAVAIAFPCVRELAVNRRRKKSGREAELSEAA